MTQEELEHLLENVDWEPKVDPLWADASRQRLVAYADRMVVHRRHVRHWRLTLGPALAILLVVLWWTQTAPLRTAIHATAQLPDSIRLLQETQRGTSSSDLAESSLRQTWNNLIALVTPGARLAVVTDARRDSATGLVSATVRGTDGYILVDPHSKSLVGVVGMKVPSDTPMQEPSSSQQVASSGTLVAVRLQQVKETDPDLTAIVNTVEGRVVQIVDTTQLKGLVISDFAGAYAVVDKQGS